MGRGRPPGEGGAEPGTGNRDRASPRTACSGPREAARGLGRAPGGPSSPWGGLCSAPEPAPPRVTAPAAGTGPGPSFLQPSPVSPCRSRGGACSSLVAPPGPGGQGPSPGVCAGPGPVQPQPSAGAGASRALLRGPCGPQLLPPGRGARTGSGRSLPPLAVCRRCCYPGPGPYSLGGVHFLPFRRLRTGREEPEPPAWPRVRACCCQNFLASFRGFLRGPAQAWGSAWLRAGSPRSPRPLGHGAVPLLRVFLCL